MKMAPIGRRQWHYLKGLGGVALSEELCHGEWALRLQKPKPDPVSLFQLPMDLDVELSATSPTPHLPGGCHAFYHDDNGLNL